MSEVCTPAELRKYFDFDLAAGLLFWRERSPDIFQDGGKTAAHQCAVWNSRWAGKPALTYLDPEGYLRGTLLYRPVKAHRVLVALRDGQWPDEVDHENGVRSDNRSDNLRSCTSQENSRNARRSARNTSGVTGVKRHKEKWRAEISGRHLGLFASLEDAAAARRAAEAEAGFHINHGRHYRYPPKRAPQIGS